MASSIIASGITKTVTVSLSATPSSTIRATPQGGILQGGNPSKFDPKNPIILFIIQAGIILIFCRLLHFPLSRLRQPRVIAEVIGGILLGPSVFGRIPGFTEAIFPVASMPPLTLVANLGLLLFLFLVGLEVDLRYLMSNWKVALSVGAAGMALPFGLGCAIAWGLYNQFKDEPGTKPISFPVYMLFIGIAMAITAFPVLCRILTELKLLSTPVGVIVLSAGVGNDVVGWILLALCVTLVNAGTGIVALWVLLTALAWTLFLSYAVRPVFMWILKRTGSLQNGPTQTVVALTLLMMLTSAFFTGVIGIHPIFGAFLVGLLCPHDGGFAIKLAEKIEDLVSVLFLPLYFALSGLSTNLGLLNNGITWAYVIGVVAVAFFGKVIGGTLAARSCKLVWRESLTIGTLMSCKGLVELIVLNIGLSAKILSTRVFTIFVVMALITTFATTPLTSALYPTWYQKKLESWKRGEIDWNSKQATPDDFGRRDSISIEKLQTTQVGKMLVYLRLDSMPSLLAFVTLLAGEKSPEAPPKVHRLKQDTEVDGYNYNSNSTLSTKRSRPLEIHGVRMLELTERTSSVMNVSEVDEDTIHDPVVNIFRTFGQLNNIAVSGEVAVVPGASYASTLADKASELCSDLVLIPWSETGSIGERGNSFLDGTENRYTSGLHNQFVNNALSIPSCNTAIFINNGFGGHGEVRQQRLERTLSRLSQRSNLGMVPSLVADRSHHVFFPYFGGADDRVALRLVLQLAQNTNITATIIHISNADAIRQPEARSAADLFKSPEKEGVKVKDSPVELNNDVVGDISFFASLRDSLPSTLSSRVVFQSVETVTPLEETLARAKIEVGGSPKNAGDLIVVGRKSHFTDSDFVRNVGLNNAASERRQCIGQTAEAMMVEVIQTSLLVVQAGARLQERQAD